MNNSVKPRTIKNLRDLHLEQARIKRAYKKQELEFIDTLTSTDAILIFALKKILKPRKKTSNNLKASSESHHFFKQNKDTSKPSIENQDKKEPERRHKKSFKRLGKSLIIWQVSSLLLFIGGNVLLYYKKQKSRKPSK